MTWLPPLNVLPGVSERELLERILRRLDIVEDLLWDINEIVNPLQGIIVPLVESNNMTVAASPVPFPLNDDESLPLGLALVGSNPNNLTIVSAVWSVDATVSINQTPPALTATAVAAPGTDGVATVTAVVTLSDGSTLDFQPFQIEVGATPVPLSGVIVPGTPTVNA